MAAVVPLYSHQLPARGKRLRTHAHHRVLLVLAGCVCAMLAGTGATPVDPQLDAVRGLLQRRLPHQASAFTLELIQPQPGGASKLQQRFEISQPVPGQVRLAGTSGVAVASALNHYLKYDCGVQINVWWTEQTGTLTDATATAAPLPAPTPIAVTSPYTFQNYLNICAFGYSTPFYTWARWEQEIDWMALNGVVNPLAMVGQDALWLDTFVHDFGLDKDALLSDFFTGAPFSPWHWMGNINGWGGPVDELFLEQQLDLQRNITARMVAYGMQPVLPAFAGHVPQEMRSKYPAANITQNAPWHGHFAEGTFFLSPSSPLFKQIGGKFLQRQASNPVAWRTLPLCYTAIELCVGKLNPAGNPLYLQPAC